MSDYKPPAWTHAVSDAREWIGQGSHFTWIAAACVVAAALFRFCGPALVSGRRRIKLRNTAARRSVTGKVGPLIGAADDATQFIEWPKHPDQPGATIAVRVPAGKWHTAVGKAPQIEQLIIQHVGGTWHAYPDPLHDRLRWTRLTPPFAWPTALAAADLPAPTRDRINLGIVEGGQPFVWDLTVSTHAHGLVVGTTGAGKSNALRLLIAEFAQAGALIDILDAKGGEDFEDFDVHPGIRVWTDAADMLRVLDEFRDEMNRRRPTRGQARRDLPRRVLVMDETAEVKTAIRQLGALGAGYVDTLLTVARLARSVRMHLVLATQKPAAKALTGDAVTGAELRDLLGFKLGLGQLSASSANMTFDAEPPPVALVAGRGVVYINGQFTHVQTARLEMGEAVKLALRGVASFPPQAVNNPVNSVNTPLFTPENGESETPVPTETERSHEPVTYAPADPTTRQPVLVTCGECGAVYASRSASVSRCSTCGHRQRVKAAATA